MGETLRITGLTIDDIQTLRPLLLEFARRPLEKTGAIRYMTPEHVIQFCIERDWQCWIVMDSETVHAALFTSIKVHPTGYRSLVVELAVGKNAKGWATMACEVMKRYAIANGCNELIATGRTGWKRLLAHEPAEENVELRLELKDG